MNHVTYGDDMLAIFVEDRCDVDTIVMEAKISKRLTTMRYARTADASYEISNI
jgi:hypothetical protein